MHMQIQIQTRGFVATDAIRDYALRRLQFVLNNSSDVRTADITLLDLNGPKGGLDKCCKIRLSVVGETPITIEDTHGDLYAAIDSAADRCKRALTRRVRKLRDRQQHSVSIKRLGAQ